MSIMNRWSTLGAIALAALFAFGAAPSGFAQTPVSTSGGCGSIASPVAGHMGHQGHDSTSGHQMAGHHGQSVPYDLFYIDMMIPHHESVIALAEVARHELTHPELIAMAEAIVATQGEEFEQLKAWRTTWYPDADPVSMEAMMAMPGLEHSMSGMDEQMSAEWQMQHFCSAENFDLAFIDQVIPHHQMAVDSSIVAPEMAEHPELIALAAEVVVAQQAEIETLQRIRAELIGSATPAA